MVAETVTVGGTATAEAARGSVRDVIERGFANVFKTGFLRVWLVLPIALIGATNLVTVAAGGNMYVAATEDLIQQAFVQMEIGYEQGVDSNGEPIWMFSHRGITAMLLPHDRIEPGAFGSLLLYAAWSTEMPFEFSIVNDWNRRARFGRAYVDDQGDPVIELDVLLSGGVTLETVKLYIDVFVDSALSLASVIQQ